MNFRKITHGWAEQTFNDIGECLGQTFFAGDQVEYETEDGDPINIMDMPLAGREYFIFDMVQPGNIKITAQKSASRTEELKHPYLGVC
uniref:Uncharacterized protein n=2 Tax=viral metagenome TaxID=1070528 RepID=A0A6M3KV10_9ZZZZ